jgi:hypothetical protein
MCLPSPRELVDVLKSGSANDVEGRSQHTAGSVAQAMDTAAIKVEEQYIVHALLEPRAAVAEWNGD